MELGFTMGFGWASSRDLVRPFGEMRCPLLTAKRIVRSVYIGLE